MTIKTKVKKLQLGVAMASLGPMSMTNSAYAQSSNSEDVIEEVVITGSRITRPGTISSSPIQTITAEEISFQQEVEVERILRDLPATIAGDGQNTNNGTEGAATVDLRGLGSERNLILLNGRRVTPFNYNGEVDTSIIPTALIDRIDIVTGGASAVYGSDAIAGAINIIMKTNFEGLDLQVSKSTTEEGDGDIDNISLTIGSNLADGRGNVAMNISYAKREQLLLGQRPLGQLGIATEDGSNYDAFLAGQPPAPSTVAGCDGPNAVAAGGSTTSIPTRIAIAGAGGVGQFLNDRTVFTGDGGDGEGQGCSLFNFNPFNFYRTPNERYSGTFMGNFDFSDKAEVYTRFTYSNVTVDAQVAPSGTFGARFDVPVANPFFSDQARQALLDTANAGVAAGNLSAGSTGDNWNDVNGNGIVDMADYLKLQLRRRTVELGARSERFDTNYYQFVAGLKGELYGDWDYDISYQYGESNRTGTRAGYTNLTNIQNALDTVDGVTCANGDSSCVPIDLFGGFGTITPAMAAYAQAIALYQQSYDQEIGTVIVSGPVDFVELPWASLPLAMSFGYESRDEFGSYTPDECLKLAPASCQGGAGGNVLPVGGGFKVDEFFLEGNLPLIDGVDFIDSMVFEFGYRDSDYSTTGKNNTWKAGLNWRVNDQLLLRVMQQDATRAPNVGELFSPVTTGLDNATRDPCSIANVANIDARLIDLCVSTGMLASQVGVVQDIVSGQINVKEGSDPSSLPGPEQADTFTAGFVWTPNFDLLPGFNLSLDYYDIDITGFIGELSAQEILDQCYTVGIASACANIDRVDGDLTSPSSGLNLTTTNLKNYQAEGLELTFRFDYELGDLGDLQFSGTVNRYLTQQFQTTSISPVIDCNGRFGTDCDPLSETSWVQRTTWRFNDDMAVSLNWRHMSGIDIQDSQLSNTFSSFQSIDSYNYLDLYASYSLFDDQVKISFGIDNLTEEDAPVVGNEAGSTAANSGNTFPSAYDVLGRIYTLGISYRL